MAALSRFYHPQELKEGVETTLDGDTSKHIVQVLRMAEGTALELTNGKGTIALAEIVKADKKRCGIHIKEATHIQPPASSLTLAIAFTKNASRNEWVLEKATELGVSDIIPLSTTRTEREKIKRERWENILVSAMIQSQQAYLPALHELTNIKSAVEVYRNTPQKLIAHCLSEKQRVPLSDLLLSNKDTLLFIGPEGDFTMEEVEECESAGFKGILLGTNRLRTETAAIAACSYFYMINRK